MYVENLQKKTKNITRCLKRLSEIVKIIPTGFAQVFFLFSTRKSMRIVNYLKIFQRRKMEKVQAKGRNILTFSLSKRLNIANISNMKLK